MSSSVKRLGDGGSEDDADANADDEDISLEDRIRRKLIESGERDRLKQLLRDRLLECGWKDEVKQRCIAYVQRKGRDNITTEDIVRAVRPEGRSAVPDSVKAELLSHIKTFMQSIQ